MMGGFIFGWAKPVPVTYQNLRKPKTDMAWVALAGPMANLVMAVIWALATKIGFELYQSGTAVGVPMLYMGVAGVLINTMLMMLNLLPLPPLDGGRILVSLLPGPLAWQVGRIEPYGFFILVALLYFGILSMVLRPLMGAFIHLLEILFSLPTQIFSIL
jgi:Zn-dependent protease